MGACFSTQDNTDSGSLTLTTRPTAKVVSLNGELREYIVPIPVSQVLLSESATTSSSDCFLCNSDSLLYDDYIPALGWNDCLRANQIYFLLPKSKLQYRLSASDMAAMAVKASVALQDRATRKESRRRKKARISPAVHLQMNQLTGGDNNNNYELLSSDQSGQGHEFIRKKFDGETATIGKGGYGGGGGISRSGSVRRLQRYTSRRAKLAVRSFRLRLSTIYEGIVV